jgi:WD40 repeat protein
MKTATFSSDGDWVVVDAYEGVYLFGREDNVPEWTFAVDEVFSVAISENGDYIAAGTSEGVYLFGREDNVPEWTYLKSNPLFVVISSDGEFIAAAFDDFYVFPQWVDYPPDINVVRLFSRYDNVPIWIHEFGGGSLDISSDGRYLAFVKGRERLRVFDRVENLLIVDLPTPFRAFKGRGHINWISMSADGKYIALGVEDTTRGFFQRKSDFVALFSVPENRVLWVY